MKDLHVEKPSLEVGDLGQGFKNRASHKVYAARKWRQLDGAGDPGHRAAADQRSPGSFAGYIVTGTDWSSAVRTMRFCSSAWATG